MEMGEEVDECTFWEWFTEIEIVYNDVGIGYDPWHVKQFILKCKYIMYIQILFFEEISIHIQFYNIKLANYARTNPLEFS